MELVPAGLIYCMVFLKVLFLALFYILYTSPLGEVTRRHNMKYYFYTEDSHIYFLFNSDSSVIVPRIEVCLHDIVT